MRRLILLMALALAFAPSLKAQTFVQCVPNENNSSTAVAAAITNTGGNFLVAFVGQRTDATGTVAITDNSGSGTWTQTASGYITDSASGGRAAMFVKPNAAAGTSVTSTWNGTKSFIIIIVCEFSGMAPSSPEDTSVNSGTTAIQASLTSGTYTTTNAKDVLFYCVNTHGTANTFTAGASFTAPTGGQAFAPPNALAGCQYQIVSATQSSQTTSMSFLNSERGESVFGAFKALAAKRNGSAQVF